MSTRVTWLGHATLQIERGDATHPCRLAPDDVV